MTSRIGVLFGIAMLALLPGLGWAQSAESRRAAVKALSERIDALIEARWKEAGIQPAPLAGDGTYFRRVNLDIVGRIPGLASIPFGVTEYTDDFRDLYRWGWLVTEREMFEKRYKWINQMLDTDDFARHWANVYRHFMIQSTDNVQAQGLAPSFERFIEAALKNNMGYDKIVREILTASPFNQPFFDGRNQPVGSPSAFYFANENKPENLAGATSRVFLGVKLECAQCHAHPFAKWTKNQFWEYAAFFSGINPNQGRRFDKGGKGGIQPVNFQGREIVIPGTNKTVKAKFLNGADPVWRDGVDSRTILADWVTAPDNPFFARAAVDLTWSYLFGQSILEPVMEPSDDHPVTHPELLELLAKEFIAQKYDVKFLIAAIVNSKAYRRSSESHDKMHKDDYYFFARMPVRSLSPEQLFDSIEETTGPRDGDRSQRMNFNQFQFNGGPLPPRFEFINKFASIEKRTEAQTSILQALFLMNGKYLTEKTKVQNNQTLLDLAKTTDPIPKRIKSLYFLVLSRPPTEAETARLVRYLESPAKPEEFSNLSQALTGGAPTVAMRRSIADAFSDIYWALLNGAEFMLNH